MKRIISCVLLIGNLWPAISWEQHLQNRKELLGEVTKDKITTESVSAADCVWGAFIKINRDLKISMYNYYNPQFKTLHADHSKVDDPSLSSFIWEDSNQPGSSFIDDFFSSALEIKLIKLLHEFKKSLSLDEDLIKVNEFIEYFDSIHSIHLSRSKINHKFIKILYIKLQHISDIACKFIDFKFTYY